MKSSEIFSLDNSLVKHLVKIRKDRAYRYAQKSVLITGLNLIQELIPELSFKSVFLEKDFSLPPGLVFQSPFYRTDVAVLRKITGLETPPSLVVEAEMPAFVSLSRTESLLILDGVSDPGNLGTLLRSAAAFNWDAVFFAPNCTDPFNEKAIRAAKGATFRLSLSSGSWEDLTHYLHTEAVTTYVAALGHGSFKDFCYKPPYALILGNEAQGASIYAKKIAQPLSIPMQGKMQSLNVSAAGAILMYELKVRQS